MSKKAESRLQLRVQKALRNEFRQAYVRKIHGNEFQHAGIADLICCIEGYFLAIEVKMPGEELTDLQSNEVIEVENAGGHYITARSPEDAIKWVRKILNALDRSAKTRATSRARARHFPGDARPR